MSLPLSQTETEEPPLPETEHQRAINAFWNSSYQTLYNVFFQEALSSALADRWMMIDTVTSILVATTASGSAIAGWALWEKPGWQNAWLVLAGAVSFSSIIHSGLQVPTRLKTQEDFRRRCSRLRVELETFRQRLELGLGTMKFFEESFIEFRSRYAELINVAPSDIANTYKLRVRIQRMVNDFLKDEIHE